MFLTGYGQEALPEVWRTVVRVEKPFDRHVLLAGVASARQQAPFQLMTRRSDRISRKTWELIRLSRNRIMESWVRRDKFVGTQL